MNRRPKQSKVKPSFKIYPESGVILHTILAVMHEKNKKLKTKQKHGDLHVVVPPHTGIKLHSHFVIFYISMTFISWNINNKNYQSIVIIASCDNDYDYPKITPVKVSLPFKISLKGERCINFIYGQ